jgi:hypothetical protein
MRIEDLPENARARINVPVDEFGITISVSDVTEISRGRYFIVSGVDAKGAPVTVEINASGPYSGNYRVRVSRD